MLFSFPKATLNETNEDKFMSHFRFKNLFKVTMITLLFEICSLKVLKFFKKTNSNYKKSIKIFVNKIINLKPINCKKPVVKQNSDELNYEGDKRTSDVEEIENETRVMMMMMMMMVNLLRMLMMMIMVMRMVMLKLMIVIMMMVIVMMMTIIVLMV